MKVKRASRAGFSMLELAVVLSIGVLLFALVIPAIYHSRAAARQTQCSNHLRQIGVSLRERSIKNLSPGICTGAIYPRYDGNPTNAGWVADVLDSGMPVENFFCPDNPARITESLSIENLVAAFNANKLPASVTDDMPATLQSYQDLLLQRGYNTNYCQMWTFARTDVLPTRQRKGVDPNEPLDPLNCVGPLRERDLMHANSTQVMLLGDGHPLSMAPEYSTTITGGPMDVNDPKGEHDVSGLGMMHGAGNRRAINILFADGHVGVVFDLNGDSFPDADDFKSIALTRGLKAKAPH